MGQKQLQGRKGLFQLTLPGNSLSRRVRVGTQAETMMECCFLACSLSDAQLAFLYSPGPSISLGIDRTDWALPHQLRLKTTQHGIHPGQSDLGNSSIEASLR